MSDEVHAALIESGAFVAEHLARDYREFAHKAESPASSAAFALAAEYAALLAERLRAAGSEQAGERIAGDAERALRLVTGDGS